MRRSSTRVCISAAVLAVPLAVACATSPSGGDNPGGGSSSSGGSGGNGSGNPGGSNSGGSNGGGSSGSGGRSSSGSGGSNGGGSNSGGSSGASSSGGGSSGASSGSSGGGSSGSSSGGSSTGVIIDAGSSACGTPTDPNVLSDFEQSGGSVLLPKGGRTGWWYVFADTMAGTQTPPSMANGPIAVDMVANAPTGDRTLPGETCNKGALHSTASGHTAYTGVGATFVPNGMSKVAYDLTTFDGIQFDIAGKAGAQPVYFEVLTKETQPTTLGGSLATTANATVAINNNRGYYFTAAGQPATSTSTPIPTSWTTVYVPFSLLIPRHFPQPGPTGCGTDNCQAPAFVPTNALGFQFSAYPDMNNTNGSYDLWIDNVALYTGDNGLNPSNPTTAPPTFSDGAGIAAACKSAIPTFAGSRKAAGKYLLWAYNNWKNHFVVASGGGFKVIRPENNNDTVSEGIGYGMLLAVYFNDKALFDGLWTYEQANKIGGTNLMTWNNTGGQGSATDADEDIAFALVEAGKKGWTNGATNYASAGLATIQQILSGDIDTANNLPKGGNQYGIVTNSPTNPSYFAPAYYRVFATIDLGNAAAWNSLATHVISVVATLSAGNGLVPAWCANNCTTAGSNGAPTDGIYQYDAHRVPWRIGLDWCWNGTSAAQTYLNKISAFFNGVYATSGTGIDSIFDLYNLNGGQCTTCTMPTAQPNSMSAVGTAAVGAMAGGATYVNFVQAGWQFILDGGNRATLDVKTTGASPYSYFNATVGLLTALTLSGNFYPM